jgi:N utilization substance protein A
VQKLKYNTDTLRYISLFEKITRCQVKDCLDTADKLVFVVMPGQAQRAVGAKGAHVIKLKEVTGKDIQIIEYSDEPVQFVKNVFHNYGVKDVTLEERGNIIHATVTVDPAVKGRAIGKDGRNLRIARDIVSRHHNIQSISVA